MNAKIVTVILTVAEAAILAAIGILISRDPANESLTQVFTVMSIIIVLNRAINNFDDYSLANENFTQLKKQLSEVEKKTEQLVMTGFGDLENPIKQLAITVDINTNSRVEGIKTLLNTYNAVANPKLKPIKEAMLQRTINELEQLNFEQKTPVLDEPDFYNWLYTEFADAKSTIHIVSMDDALEWTDTPEERTYYGVNVETAQRGVDLRRVFVFDSGRLQEAAKNQAIYGHRRGSDTKLIGKYVDKARFTKQSPDALKAAGQGFIVIDERMVIIDVFSPDGAARGYITFNPAEIKKYEDLYKKFYAVAQDLVFD